MIVEGLTGKLMAGSGSFANINIDGRLSFNTASGIARRAFIKEAAIKNSNYIGFAIEKGDRFLDYKNPIMVDSTATAKEISFLL
jgi:hypothetical protein